VVRKDCLYVMRYVNSGSKRLLLPDAAAVGCLTENSSIELTPRSSNPHTVDVRTNSGGLIMHPVVSNVVAVESNAEWRTNVHPIVERDPDQLELAAAYGAVEQVRRIASGISQDASSTRTRGDRKAVAEFLRQAADRIERGLQ